MKIKAVSGIMLTLLLISMLTLAFNIRPVESEPTTWTVDDDGPADFHTVQEAINAANPGDTVYVYNGTYYEQVTIGKSISLVGENKYNTIIDGSGWGHASMHVIQVLSTASNLSGFTIRNGYIGIGVYGNNNNISNNIITNSYRSGILLGVSYNNTLAGNTVSTCEYGIVLEFARNNTVAGNTVSSNVRGIWLRWSSGNFLSGNNASNNQCNFGVVGIEYLDFNNHVDVSNTVDGKPIYYLVGVANAVYDAKSNAGTVYLINCNNITVKDLTLTKNWNGVFLWNTTNSKMENLIVSNNQYAGIWLEYSNNNTLSGNNASSNSYDGFRLYRSNINTLNDNTASNNSGGISLSFSRNNNLIGNTVTNNHVDGISFDRSNNNSLTCNIVSNNSWGGIYLKTSKSNSLTCNIVSNNKYGIELWGVSNNNTIYHNNFIHNMEQVASGGSPNMWDDGYPSGGNYWSDHVCTGNPSDGSQPYYINENNIDHYPFQDPNGWIKAPIIVATVDVNPEALNLRSRGEWITCYIELPEGYKVGDIDVSTVMLNETIHVSLLDVPAPEPVPTEIGDYDNDTVPDLMVKFDRTMVSELILSKGIRYGSVALTITGEVDGTPFEGSDTIRVLLPSRGRGHKR